MNQPIPAWKVTLDARSRAARTCVQGLAVDVVGAVVLAVAPEVIGSHFAWSRAYWTALALLGAKTAVQSAFAYAMRKAVPPKQ